MAVQKKRTTEEEIVFVLEQLLEESTTEAKEVAHYCGMCRGGSIEDSPCPWDPAEKVLS